MQKSKRNMWALILPWGIFALIIALFVYNQMNTEKLPNLHVQDGAWHESMVMGNADAPNKFIEYTDYFCSYCEKVVSATGDDFKKEYIDNDKMSFENRIVTVLSGVSPNTVQGAHAAHCSAEQDKYWEFSKHLVPRIKTDYYDKGIGIKEVVNPVPIEKLPIEYFLVSARAVGIDEAKFEECVASEKYQKTIEDDTKKAINLGVNGLPFMVVNDYVSNGFAGGYDQLKYVLKAGGVE